MNCGQKYYLGLFSSTICFPSTSLKYFAHALSLLVVNQPQALIPCTLSNFQKLDLPDFLVLPLPPSTSKPVAMASSPARKSSVLDRMVSGTMSPAPAQPESESDSSDSESETENDKVSQAAPTYNTNKKADDLAAHRKEMEEAKHRLESAREGDWLVHVHIIEVRELR